MTTDFIELVHTVQEVSSPRGRERFETRLTIRRT